MGYITQSRHGRRLGENISADFRNAQALTTLQTTQALPDGFTDVSVTPNPLNLPGDTPLFADPNAAAIVAEQAITNPPGSWASSTGYGYGSSTPPSSNLLSAVPWYVWALGVMGLVLVVKR